MCVSDILFNIYFVCSNPRNVFDIKKSLKGLKYYAMEMRMIFYKYVSYKTHLICDIFSKS